MKYITVKLTEDQIREIKDNLLYFEDEPLNSRYNAFVKRIHTKLNKALAESQD